MHKNPPTTACGILGVTKEFAAWRANQCWLAERVRTVTTLCYAQVQTEPGRNSTGAPAAVHKAAITAQVSRAFGALYDETAPQLLVSWIVDLLVQIADFGDVGFGYYIPRESRIIRLSPTWARIAGGLPLDASEHPGGGLRLVLDDTVGRAVKLADDFRHHDHETEHSEVYAWQSSTNEEICARLLARLPERPVTQPQDGITEFYNVAFRGGRTRGDRWQKRTPAQDFIVARSGTLPTNYFLILTKPGHRGEAWFELDKEAARRWILLAERTAGLKNLIPLRNEHTDSTFWLPNMLPGAWTSAILACASAVTPDEDRAWRIQFNHNAFEPMDIVLRSANIHFT